MREFFNNVNKEDDSIFNAEEKQGLKSIRKRVNDGEIVITFTDKNGRVVVFFSRNI